MNRPSPASELEQLLVSTKFAPPRIGARYIVRTQLLEALRRDRQAALTLVTGSAGFGKTILLAQWRQELMKDGAPVAWLTLSHDESQLANFRTHLFAAFARLGLSLPDETMFASGGNAPIDGAVAALVNGLAAIDEDLYLILDDYHCVEDPWAHKLVQKLLDHGPANLHLVIASRALPPLSIARLRVMGQVAEVECADLPFDLAETRAFLEQNVGQGRLGADEMVQIQDFTNGWPASLQLVSIMLKNRPESRSTLHSLAWESTDLQDYLSENVVGHLPSELSEFMESLSVCRRFNAPLAAAITGRSDAADLIERIEEENLLIVRAESEDRSPWFRFHPLFAEFLAKRLARRDPEAACGLHRLAARWLADKRLIIEAVRHASMGGDLDVAVSIIERSVPDAWKLSYLGPMLHLLGNLPAGTIAAHPRLLYLGAITLALTGSPARAEALVAEMRGGDRAAEFRIALASALIAMQRDDTRRMMTLLQTFDIDESGSAFERYAFRTLQLISLAAEGSTAEWAAYADSHPVPPDELDQDMALLSNGSVNTCCLIEGRFARARPLAESNHKKALAVLGHHSAVTALGGVGLAEIRYEQDQIDDARELLAKWDQAMNRTPPQMMIWATVTEARLDLLQKSPEAALDLLDRQTARFRALGLDRGVAWMLAEQVRIQLGAGNRLRAMELVRSIEQLETASGETSGLRAEIPVVAAIARARLALKSGNAETALRETVRAMEVTSRLGRGRLATVLHILAALAHDAAGRTDEAVERLGEAVRLGAELGLVRTFVDEGEPVRRLLTQVEEHYAQQLLGHFDAPAGNGAGDHVLQAKAPLTPRELEILGLVAAGMSNKRIALTLGITLETVKWNLKNVFVKLGVSSRYDAMIWARRKGLIS